MPFRRTVTRRNDALRHAYVLQLAVALTAFLVPSLPTLFTPFCLRRWWFGALLTCRLRGRLLPGLPVL